MQLLLELLREICHPQAGKANNVKRPSSTYFGERKHRRLKLAISRLPFTFLDLV